MMRLVKDKALVIVGPQGCGKTEIARKVAASAGSFIEAEGFSLRTKADWLALIAHEPTSILIDGLPHDSQMPTIKQILSEKGGVAVRINGAMRRISMPHLIFTTNDFSECAAGAKYRALLMDRRVDVQYIHQPGHA